ncbi:MAG: hypothetical protein E6R03_06755, partial [Hyphomicrobiaceae bacterium]
MTNLEVLLDRLGAATSQGSPAAYTQLELRYAALELYALRQRAANADAAVYGRETLRRLLGKALNIIFLPGHAFSSEERELACALSGCYTEPYLTGKPAGD